MDYEKLGAFYLGRSYDLEAREPTDSTLLYDAKDLTTHAVVIGMTGSGKTGLGVTLLEEALIDGIPVIAIDPKGDLGNLLLTFPSLQPGDFLPWIDESDAARSGRTPDEHARWTADLWRKGLADWDQGPERIAKFEAAGERALYTPGSRIGRPLSVLRSFAAPPASVVEDPEALRERIAAAASSLLGLLGVRADPLRSREYILLSTLFERAWAEGRDLDIPTLIGQIQSPPVQRVGVLDLDSFYPAGDRFELAMSLNNLLASPGFDAWSDGDPLDVGKLLRAVDGRPRLSVLSIAHLDEAERMFFVTLVLNELIAWMRSQPGSSSLRALLYMDEVFGYFPPTANPPSKTPMLTLLKQARAYGLGCVLATQNPVDLDYKGLSNAGTWFIGRLQTERDKARVIEGLEGAAASASGGFDRAIMAQTLASLGSRVFLMNNVHDDAPVVFHTRWALSYLAGPLARDQIKTLTLASAPPIEPRASASREAPREGASPAATERAAGPPATEVKRPVLPPDVREGFLPITREPGTNERLIYRPALAARVSIHYANARAGVDEWRQSALLSELEGNAAKPWESAREIGGALPEFDSEPAVGAAFADLPGPAARAKSYPRWEKMLETHVYREKPIVLWKSTDPKATSLASESEGEFRGRLVDLGREKRDLEIEKLRRRYAPKLKRMQDKIERAEERVEIEQEQYAQSKRQTAISVGATVIGALFGRKLSSRSVGRATTAMRGASRSAREKGDIDRAEERLDDLREELAALEQEFQDEIAELEDPIEPRSFELDELRIAPRKSDLAVDDLMLIWTPWRVGPNGIAEPAFER